MPKAYPLTLYYVCCLVTIFSNIFLPLFFISRILVCAPLSWSTEHFPPAEVGGLLPEFFHARLSSERDIPAQACRFSCFFCAAYRLLLTQTRTQCSNSASRAIAMLANPAKICQRYALGSGDIRTLIMESCQSVQMAVRKPSSPTLPLRLCFVDQESGAHTTRQIGSCGNNYKKEEK